MSILIKIHSEGLKLSHANRCIGKGRNNDGDELRMLYAPLTSEQCNGSKLIGPFSTSMFVVLRTQRNSS